MPAQPEEPFVPARQCCVCECEAELKEIADAGAPEGRRLVATLYCEWHWIHETTQPCHNCGVLWDERLRAYVQRLPLDWPRHY